MSDTTIKKVEAASSPRGEMGQKYLVAGKRVSMRLWDLEPGGEVKHRQAEITKQLGTSSLVARHSTSKDILCI